MKLLRSLFLVVSVIALNTGFAAAQARKSSRDLTLSEARAALVGKKVVIIGKTSQNYPLKGYLHDWKIAVESGGES
jgi:membrane protein implicated in regulation of membrane protease activity